MPRYANVLLATLNRRDRRSVTGSSEHDASAKSSSQRAVPLQSFRPSRTNNGNNRTNRTSQIPPVPAYPAMVSITREVHVDHDDGASNFSNHDEKQPDVSPFAAFPGPCPYIHVLDCCFSPFEILSDERIRSVSYSIRPPCEPFPASVGEPQRTVSFNFCPSRIRLSKCLVCVCCLECCSNRRKSPMYSKRSCAPNIIDRNESNLRN